MAKPIKKIILGGIIMGALFSLTGCLKRYSIEDMKKDAERKLEDTYGEEFVVTEIFNVQEGRAYQAYAHSVDNPSVVFACNYNIEDKDNSSEYASDCYIGELVAYQYKQLAEQILDDCNYDYYVDVYMLYDKDMNSKFDKNVTIEEFSQAFEYRIDYWLFISDDILSEDNQFIYEILNKIYEIEKRDIIVLFVTNNDLRRVKEEFTGKPEMSGSFSSDFLDQYFYPINSHAKVRSLAYPMDMGEIITDFEVFEKHMEEVR